MRLSRINVGEKKTTIPKFRLRWFDLTPSESNDRESPIGSSGLVYIIGHHT